jgi:hypothetical protein
MRLQTSSQGLHARLRRRIDAEGGQNFRIEAFLVVGHRHIVDVGDVERLDDGGGAHCRTATACGARLPEFRGRRAPAGCRGECRSPQFLDGMLGRLGLQLARSRNVGHQRQVDVDGGAARQIVAELADRLQERHRLDIADGAADLAHDEIIVVIAFGDEILDLVGDVRNDLNGRAEIVAARSLLDDVLVDAAGGDVVWSWSPSGL